MWFHLKMKNKGKVTVKENSSVNGKLPPGANALITLKERIRSPTVK